MPRVYGEAIKADMQAILTFVKQYHKEHRMPPRLIDIAVGIGRSEADAGNISPLIQTLIEEGFLERGEGSYRNLMLSKHPPRRVYYKPKETEKEIESELQDH